MATERLYNIGIQLISPPPEDTLDSIRTSTSKRKRTLPVIPTEQCDLPQEATPNPKPKKQSKHQPTRNHSPTRTPSRQHPPLLVKSPHASNPEADFIPDLPLDVPRRSVATARVRRTTPIPPYEPPTDVFTPPREVIMTPSMSKSSKRKTNTKQITAKGKKILKVVIPAPSVKKELPDIDLSVPMPPPSPGDDPLLLSGPILPPSSTPTRPPKQRECREVGVVTSASLTRIPALHPHPSIPMSFPPSSSPADDMEGLQPFDWARHADTEGSTDLSLMDMDECDTDVPRLPLFDVYLADLPASSDTGGWTDSDDDDDVLPGGGGPREDGEVMEGEGEYTGKWKIIKVPTKLDPPSSATKERMEEWGRPITPYPKRISMLHLLKEVHGEEEPTRDDIDMPKDREEATDEEEEREVREMSVPLDNEDDQEEEQVRQMSVAFESQDQDCTPNDAMQGPFDFDASIDDPVFAVGELPRVEVAPQEELEDVSVVETDAFHDDQLSVTRVSFVGTNEEDEEEHQVRQMSVDFDDEEDSAKDRDASGRQNASASLGFPPLTPLDNQQSAFQLCPSRPSAAPLEGSADMDKETERTSLVHMTPQEREAPVVEETSAEVADDDSSDDESDAEGLGVVKITSADPRAAARAAAILKQHNYDCFSKIVMKERRRQSCSGVDGLTKSARRKTISGAGIVKSKDRERERRRRSMGVIGDEVYIPGSPAMTLPELLREAEADIVTGTPAKRVGIKDSFKTPLQPTRFGAGMTSPVVVDRDGDDRKEGAWGKEDWKQLDACFTDERLEIGRRLDIDGDEGLAPVDSVSVEDVVQRFVLLMGGNEIVESFGDAWNRDNICQRVKALQNKQRSGNVAPPTTPYTPSPGNLVYGTTSRVPLMEVPDFTPLGRRAPPPKQRRPLFPSQVGEDTPFATLLKQQEGSVRKLPASLLAPRYSHLLEEAVAVSQLGVKVAETSVEGLGKESDVSINEDAVAVNILSTPVDDEDHSLTISGTNESPATPATIGKRVKGFLFSYLPTLSKTAPPAPRKIKQRPQQTGLPLPPPEVLEKPRGPISTPVRPPLPKPKPAKELVHLNPAPQPPKASMIPRARKPQRLVDLQPLPPHSPPKPVAIPRPRRSSGGSVKDLVRSFEDLEKQREVEKAGVKKIELKRVKSNGDWKSVIGTANKPGWRP
ncbi:hypothetical protein L208DRAFT_1380191 [Tricholoma matsutake]|nr:hypothetical protein L208DRAFT_1380191 [Tricholoma matsutake 945]